MSGWKERQQINEASRLFLFEKSVKVNAKVIKTDIKFSIKRIGADAFDGRERKGINLS